MENFASLFINSFNINFLWLSIVPFVSFVVGIILFVFSYNSIREIINKISINNNIRDYKKNKYEDETFDDYVFRKYYREGK